MGIRRLQRVFAILILCLSLNACSDVAISPTRMPSTLNPQGPGAAHLAELWWVMFALGRASYLVVIILLFAAILRRRRGTSDTAPDSSGGDTGRNWPIWGGIVFPLVVIGITFGYSMYTQSQIDQSTREAVIKIQVNGRRWWWEVKYPNEGITTANEMHIPVGTLVEVELKSADVIHSFWVPELHGKMDAIPTRTNHLMLQADEIGVYRGECAEYCGLQHAHMGFMVVVQSKEDYEAWLSAQQQQAATPTDPLALQGQQVFVDRGCVFCHTVRGLQDKNVDRSSVDLGPDLTHLSSRQTIASASLTQNRGNLAGWILDAQHVKPGSLMPNMQMNSDELHALLAYLEGLK